MCLGLFKNHVRQKKKRKRGFALMLSQGKKGKSKNYIEADKLQLGLEQICSQLPDIDVVKLF